MLFNQKLCLDQFFIRKSLRQKKIEYVSTSITLPNKFGKNEKKTDKSRKEKWLNQANLVYFNRFFRTIWNMGHTYIAAAACA